MEEFALDTRTIITLFKGFMIFAFLGSLFIFLMPDAYANVNKVLMREYGIKKMFLPWLETERKSIDVWVLKRRGVFGILFVGISFLLLVSIR